MVHHEQYRGEKGRIRNLLKHYIEKMILFEIQYKIIFLFSRKIRDKINSIKAQFNT